MRIKIAIVLVLIVAVVFIALFVLHEPVSQMPEVTRPLENAIMLTPTPLVLP